MNPFKNQIVNLSASDAIKNKKDRHIYSAAKKQFEVKNFCKKQRNLRYYRNGKVRSVVNYEYGNDLARGNILCNNCDRPDNTCGDVFKQNAQRIDMHTNEFSEFNGAGIVVPDISYNDASGVFNYIGVSQAQAFTVINSDISGSWDPSSNSWKGDISQCGPSGDIVCPYGYVNNLIDIPRNLDGKGIIIDPSNELFPDSKCGAFNYLNNSYLKANIIMRGTIDLSMNLNANFNPPPPINPIPFTSGDSCNDPSYNQFIGKFVQLVVDTGFNTFPPNYKPTTGIFYGIVKQICCLNPLVSRYGSIPWMDIHIELNNISDLDTLNKLIKFKPKFKGINWAAPISSGPFTVPGTTFGPYAWGPLQLPWALFFYDSTSITTNPLNTVRSVTVQGYFSDINFYMGNCINNLTQTNSFRDTYMSCLEDGTKNINFTKHNPVNYGTPPSAPPLPTNLSFNNSSTSTGFSPAEPYLTTPYDAYGINIRFTTAAPLTTNDIIELSFNYSDNSDFFYVPYNTSNGVDLNGAADIGNPVSDAPGYLVMGKAITGYPVVPTPTPSAFPTGFPGDSEINITTDPSPALDKGNAKTANMLKIIIQEDIPTNTTIYIQLVDKTANLGITKLNPASGTVATWGLSVSNHSPVTGLTAYTVT